MRKLRPGVPKAVLDPKSAMLMLGLANKTLVLSEWTAGPCSCFFTYSRPPPEHPGGDAPAGKDP